MRTALMKLFLSAGFILFMVNVSGCRSEEDRMLDEGIKKFENADFEAAAKIYSDIIKKDSSNYNAYIKLASANVCLYHDERLFYKNLLKAVDSRGIKTIKPEFVTDHFIIYQFSKDNLTGMIINKTDEISTFDKAINNHPDNPQLYFGRGMWHYILRHQQEAVNDFAEAIKLEKDFLSAIIMKGKSEMYYFGINDYLYNLTRAELISIFDFRRALRLDPQNSDLMEKIGAAYSRINSAAGSKKYLSMALQIDPTNIYALLQKAAIETVKGDYKSAIEDYKILVKRFPDNANYLIELAGKRIFAGQDKEALEDLEKAKKLAKYEGQIKLIESIIKKNHLRK